MTKIFLSPLLLHDRQYIADLPSQSVQRRFIAGLDVWDGREPVLRMGIRSEEKTIP